MQETRTMYSPEFLNDLIAAYSEKAKSLNIDTSFSDIPRDKPFLAFLQQQLNSSNPGSAQYNELHMLLAFQQDPSQYSQEQTAENIIKIVKLFANNDVILIEGILRECNQNIATTLMQNIQDKVVVPGGESVIFSLIQAQMKLERDEFNQCYLIIKIKICAIMINNQIYIYDEHEHKVTEISMDTYTSLNSSFENHPEYDTIIPSPLLAIEAKLYLTKKNNNFSFTKGIDGFCQITIKKTDILRFNPQFIEKNNRLLSQSMLMHHNYLMSAELLASKMIKNIKNLLEARQYCFAACFGHLPTPEQKRIAKMVQDQCLPKYQFPNDVLCPDLAIMILSKKFSNAGNANELNEEFKYLLTMFNKFMQEENQKVIRGNIGENIAWMGKEQRQSILIKTRNFYLINNYHIVRGVLSAKKRLTNPPVAEAVTRVATSDLSPRPYSPLSNSHVGRVPSRALKQTQLVTEAVVSSLQRGITTVDAAKVINDNAIIKTTIIEFLRFSKRTEIFLNFLTHIENIGQNFSKLLNENTMELEKLLSAIYKDEYGDEEKASSSDSAAAPRPRSKTR